MVDRGCWWQDQLDPYRWAVCLSCYSAADDSLSSVCVLARIWILADLLGESICSAEANVFDLRIVWGWECREEDVKKEFCEDSVLSWKFRAVLGGMCRVRHGLGHYNTEGWERTCWNGQSLLSLVSALGFLQILSNSSSTLTREGRIGLGEGVKPVWHDLCLLIL